MCILFVAVNQHKDYPLIIAANRDEFYSRPTAESRFWQDTPSILGGKDLEAGGTWMGINTQGFIASLTNVRAPHTLNAQAVTRGKLVSNFLRHSPNTNDYHHQLQATKSQYNGYNLLFGPWDKLVVYNNHTDQIQSLDSGFYGLSNADLNSPWPKINKGVHQLELQCLNDKPIDPDQLFQILLDNSPAPDSQLPKTGVPVEWERTLSSIFIASENYGTRSSTILTIDKHHKVNWHERTYNKHAQFSSEKNFHFNIK